MFKKLIGWIIARRTDIQFLSFLIVILLLCINSYFLYEDFFLKKPDLFYVISILLINLIVILLFCVFLIYNRNSGKFSVIRTGKKKIFELRKRIIIAFSIGAALPTLIVSVFSAYFFNFGVEAWFDNKVSKVLDQSIIVGESYIAEHVL